MRKRVLGSRKWGNALAISDLKVKIGSRERVGEISLTVPKGEDAWVEFKALTWDMKIHLVFEDSDDVKAESSWSLRGKSDYAEITFKNWVSAQGMSVPEPVELGSINGRSIIMFVHGRIVPGFKLVNLSFFDEAQNG